MYQVFLCNNDTGMGPSNLFCEALNIRMLLDCKKTGNVPISMLLLRSIQRSTVFSFSRLEKCPIPAGIEPVRTLSSKKRVSRSEHDDIESGMVPSKLLLSEEENK